MARHASDYVGKEFNTAKAWEMKGKIYSFELVKDILTENDLSELS